MRSLNYHHLHYFREVARTGNLTRAALRLSVSQSALSTQIRQLEESLGEPLFSREHKSLVLTEAGRISLDYAEIIFRTGGELVETLRHGTAGSRQVFRVGAMSTLSRNFQRDFLRPVLGREDVDIVLRSGSLRELMDDLAAHQLDLVLTNLAVKRDRTSAWHCHLLEEQPVSLVGPNARERKKFHFPEDLATRPVHLPSLESHLRIEFDRVLDLAGIRPVIAAEVDDMAMLRLLAREGPALTLVPPVVVQDELLQGELIEWCRIPEIREKFFAVVPVRKKPHPLVRLVLKRRSGASLKARS